MIKLDKKTGINLKKGSSIKLEKGGIKLQKVCVGLNWGAITEERFLSSLLGPTKIAVDLDGAVAMFSNGRNTETVYYGNLASANYSIIHSGDDLTGDMEGDDGLDNEIITINLDQIDDHVDTIYIFLNSYKGQDFGDIPYSKLRIYEGTPSQVNEVLATFNVSVEDKFKGYVSIIMGKLVKNGNHWDFTAIGDPISARHIEDIVTKLTNRYAEKMAG